VITLRRAFLPFYAPLVFLVVVSGFSRTAAAQPPLPELTEPVNDFANVIALEEEREIAQLSRSLMAASGDAIVVVTVDTVAPYATVRDYAVELFENHGRGIGERGKDNGLLILLAVNERRVEIEVGYGLEEWITDGYAGETSRDDMVPEFRAGRYGAGLLAGTARIVGRIAEGRNVTLTGVDLPPERPRPGLEIPFPLIVGIFIAFMLLSRTLGGPGRGAHRWGRRSGWSGWSSGVGPFGGGGWGRGGGFGGGGFGGGFGGFGGGRSGGGGGGAGW
jgi:uncharacterized protein